MAVIYKHEVGLLFPTIIKGHIHQVLDAQWQNDGIKIWTLEEPHEGRNILHIRVVGTGWEFNEEDYGDYVKTIQAPDGLVWHVFAKWVM